jgi:SAM-dependent methyltransferase
MISTANSWESAVLQLKSDVANKDLIDAAYYDDPLVRAAERYHCSFEWHAIRAVLGPARGSALDVGAGRGIASFALAKDGFDVTALEPNPSSIVGRGAIQALSLESGLAIRLCGETAEHLSFADGIFDVVFVRAALHHAHNLRRMCQELARVLRPGGLFLAIREHVISRERDRAVFLQQHPLHRYYGGENAYLLKDYRVALEAAGLARVREFRPLHSAINCAPRTFSQLREELGSRLRRIPLIGPALTPITRKASLGALTIKLLAYADNRPGRLYSFLYRKV